MKWWKRIITALLCLSLSSCSSAINDNAPPADLSSEQTSATQENLTPEQLLNQMTLHEKICQLFVVRPESLAGLEYRSGSVIRINKTIIDTLQEYPVAGVALFSQNILLPKQCSNLIADLQKNSQLPLLIGVDEEGGIVARLGNNPDMGTTSFPNMRTVGNTGNPQKAYEVGKVIGSEIKPFGFNWDFAPVADVTTNPANSVIGDRAFSSDPQVAADMVASAVKGFSDAKIITTLKHFPGHGDTTEDSHTSLSYTYKTMEELEKCEFIPFCAGIESGADVVMTAHIIAKNADSSGLPSTLSPYMLTDILRGKLGFDGVIATDSLEMQGILDLYSTKEAVTMAISAGSDLLLTPVDLQEAVQGVSAAVLDGTITEQRIDESVLRILKLKEKYGLLPI